MTITLGHRNDDPKMRCGRNKFRQMVIPFDEAPCEDILTRLREAESSTIRGRVDRQLESCEILGLSQGV